MSEVNRLRPPSSWPTAAAWSTAWPSILPTASAPSTLSPKCSSKGAGPESRLFTWTCPPRRTEYGKSSKWEWRRWGCPPFLRTPWRCDICSGCGRVTKLLVAEWAGPPGIRIPGGLAGFVETIQIPYAQEPYARLMLTWCELHPKSFTRGAQVSIRVEVMVWSLWARVDLASAHAHSHGLRGRWAAWLALRRWRVSAATRGRHCCPPTHPGRGPESFLG